jgi:hypothetical protein
MPESLVGVKVGDQAPPPRLDSETWERTDSMCVIYPTDPASNMVKSNIIAVTVLPKSESAPK